MRDLGISVLVAVLILTTIVGYVEMTRPDNPVKMITGPISWDPLHRNAEQEGGLRTYFMNIRDQQGGLRYFDNVPGLIGNPR